MKTATIQLESIKATDGWHELAHDLLWDKFQKSHPELDEDELADKFYIDVIKPRFHYGEYANLELVVDENFNIVGGKVY